MSAVVNERDITLQAASPRLLPVTLPDNIIIPALKSIALTAPSTTFRVDTAGTALPATILLTAKLTQLAGTVVFSVTAGSATLSGTGNTRTLACADMASASVTIRATLTEGATDYTSEFTIAKVLDGLAGIRTAILDVYRWAAAAPTTFPAGTSTYTWATGQFTPPATLNSWALTPPAAVAGQTLWVARVVYADALGAATSSVLWDTTLARPTGVAGTSGSNGARTAVLEMYRWYPSTPPAFPAGSSTYTWATGAFTTPATPNGWSLSPTGAVEGYSLYACKVTYSDTGTSSTTSVAWSATTAYVVGYAGVGGAAGTDGSDGVRGTRQLYLTSASYTSTWGIANYRAAATSAIATATAGSSPTTPITGDTVTFTNGTNYAYTLSYASGAWNPPGTVIDGSLLVTNTVTAGAVVTGSLTAGTLTTSKVVIAPIGSYVNTSGLAITAGEVDITLTTSSAVVTPMWSFALVPPSGTICVVAWYGNTSTTCTFRIRCISVGGAAYTGTIPVLKIWMF